MWMTGQSHLHDSAMTTKTAGQLRAAQPRPPIFRAGLQNMALEVRKSAAML
jgi:hypothetical protein